MLKEKRQKELRQRKGYLLTLVITGAFWASLVLMIFYVNPERPYAIFVFFLLLFITLLFTLALVFGNSRRGLIASVGIMLFLFLSHLGVGTPLNLLLLVGAAVAFEFYFTKNS